MEGGIDWGSEKNAALRRRYGFGFERMLVALADKRLLTVQEHLNSDRSVQRRQLVVEIDGYAWVVPFVESEAGIFLKSMFPSRRATKAFLEDKL